MSVLDELVAGAVEDQQAREKSVSLDELKRQVAQAPAPIDARRWLKKADGIPVIAENSAAQHCMAKDTVRPHHAEWTRV